MLFIIVFRAIDLRPDPNKSERLITKRKTNLFKGNFSNFNVAGESTWQAMRQSWRTLRYYKIRKQPWNTENKAHQNLQIGDFVPVEAFPANSLWAKTLMLEQIATSGWLQWKLRMASTRELATINQGCMFGVDYGGAASHQGKCHDYIIMTT